MEKFTQTKINSVIGKLIYSPKYLTVDRLHSKYLHFNTPFAFEKPKKSQDEINNFILDILFMPEQPLQPFVLFKMPNGVIIIIDGLWRLETLSDFINNKISVQYEDQTYFFNQFSKKLQLQFLKTPIPAYCTPSYHPLNLNKDEMRNLYLFFNKHRLNFK